MHNIGNRSDAEVILHWVRSFDMCGYKPYCVEQRRAPEGWGLLGYGSFRSVWRSPEGIAYKVNHEAFYDDQSISEVNALIKAWNKGAPEGCRLPKVNRFDLGKEVVVAMELIKGTTLERYVNQYGDTSNYHDKASLCASRFGLLDMHHENVMVDEDGMLVPVDFGC